MGFLHKIWDETLAGPAPETGLGRLRKFSSFSAAATPPPRLHVDHNADPIAVTRSITILRSADSSSRRHCLDTPPESPRGPSTPGSPLSPASPSWDYKRLARRKFPADEAFGPSEPRSSTDYDWIVIMSALDR